MKEIAMFGPLSTLILLLALAWMHDQSQANENEISRPNLIVIMTDEHNFRTLGCYRKTMEKRQAYMWGPSVVVTPQIDRLAEPGSMCTSFYATTPVCSPSRASFVSGLYPQATPVVSNNISMSNDVVTFAEILRQNGYRTGYAGKWHLDGDGKPQWQPKRKFGFSDNRFMFNRGHWKNLELTEEGPRVGTRKKGQPSYGLGQANERTFTTDFLINRTIDFVSENSNKPFCYMVSIPDPHGPDTVRAPYDTMYEDQEFEKPTTFEVDERTIPNWGRPDKKSKFGQAKYYGMVKCIDDNVGRLIDHLEDKNLLQNTIVIFTSDHGDLRGEHHRQNKGVAWEGSARVPFIIYHPPKVAAGRVVKQALTSVDVTPTILDLMNVPTDRTFHGRNFADLIDKDQTAGNKKWQDIAFVRSTGDKAGWLMAVTDRFKLIVSLSDQPFLYDLKRDPDELINGLDSPSYREKGMQLGLEMQKYVEDFQDPFSQNSKMMDDIQWLISGKGIYSER
ncbi:MAG: sulfatase [Planctomycetota bacterium]